MAGGRPPREPWVDRDPAASGGALDTAVLVTTRRTHADEQALVLAAEGILARVRSDGGGFAVEVSADDAVPAREVLAAWASENAEPAPRAEMPVADPLALPHAAVVAAALLAGFAWTGPWIAGAPAFERGSADAARILDGEWWRALTALTLHADLVHVAGNAIVGTLFLAGVFRIFGAGFGLLLTLAAGTLGNLANAWVYASRHDSVGASTAVFGALGLLAGHVAIRRGTRPDTRVRRVGVAVAAGLGLLAMLGTEGARVDLWAHAFGLAAGAGMGAVLAWARTTPPGASAQVACGATAVAALGAAWWWALA